MGANVNINENKNGPQSADVEPAKSPDEQVIITAVGELHILACSSRLTGDGDAWLMSQGQMHLVADHVLNSVPEGVHMVKRPGAIEG